MSAVLLTAALLAVQTPGVTAAVPVAEMIGQPVTDVVARLGATRDPAPAITIVEGGSRVDIYPASELVAATPHPMTCQTVLVPPAGLAEMQGGRVSLSPGAGRPWRYQRVAAVYVAARDGVVVSVLNPPMPPAGAPRTGESQNEHARRILQENRDPWLSLAPGRLPLSDGAAFLERRTDLSAPDGAILANACQVAPIASSPPQGPRDDAGLLQGLSLLPFAGRLKELNTERAANRVEGAALLATLHPGESLSGGLEAFLSAHPTVRRYVDGEDPAFSVLVVNLGATSNNNLARMNAAALIGVRDDRVVWIGDGGAAGGLGLTSALCIDQSGTARDARPGCSTTGFFSP